MGHMQAYLKAGHALLGSLLFASPEEGEANIDAIRSLGRGDRVLLAGTQKGGGNRGAVTESLQPSSDMAMSLGENLTQATRDKILRGEYIDFFSLLNCEIEKKDKDLLNDKEKKVLKKRKVDRTWDN